MFCSFEHNSIQEKMELTPEQQQAVVNATRHKISAMTGGAGCGKSFTSCEIARAWLQENANTKVLGLGPTGTSGDVLSASMSRLPSDLRAQVDVMTNAAFLTDVKVMRMFSDSNVRVILDEMSMNDVRTMWDVTSTLSNVNRMVLVGDARQIPPVGGRGMFRELSMNDDVVPFVYLKRGFRQMASAQKLKTAIKTLEENISKRSRTTVEELQQQQQQQHDDDASATTSSNAAEDDSFYFMDLPGNQEEVPMDVLSSFAESDDPPQFLSVTNDTRIKGNKAIQKKINGDSQETLATFGKRFRDFKYGDKVVSTGNVSVRDEVRGTKTRKFTNGSLGVIRRDMDVNSPYHLQTYIAYRVHDGNDYVERRDYYNYMTNSFETSFDLAYFLTVDKAQGSGFRNVVFVFEARRPGAELIYTAISRAQEACVVVGNRNLFATVTAQMQVMDEALLHAFQVRKAYAERANNTRDAKQEED